MSECPEQTLWQIKTAVRVIALRRYVWSAAQILALCASFAPCIVACFLHGLPTSTTACRKLMRNASAAPLRDQLTFDQNVRPSNVTRFFALLRNAPRNPVVARNMRRRRARPCRWHSRAHMSIGPDGRILPEPAGHRLTAWPQGRSLRRLQDQVATRRSPSPLGRTWPAWCPKACFLRPRACSKTSTQGLR